MGRQLIAVVTAEVNVDDTTTIPLKGLGELYYADNIKGLCFIKGATNN